MGISSGMAGAAMVTLLSVPMVMAPQANALVSPSLSVTMAGSALGATRLAAVNCPQTAVATVKMPDGSPVSHGSVDFTSRLPGLGGNIVGTVPVSNGVASIVWVPDIEGQHVISAVYFDGPPDVRPSAGYTTVTAVNLNGICA
ncbi:hypothetical protein HLB23_25010 [Nocardia uniformis]|uniref:Uncharacterized protein n=1 Tax=Nocardia uniformis TaxID=53432 RepID=A0A849C334_9NOCA|nr:hypothetical protein [Nocardia uniformis]NNH73082.1 hypothetical protein [Nocardia uniformis]